MLELLYPLLPYIWALLLSVAIFIYVVLDGFDLGIGILFPFAKSEAERDLMMNSVAPFWDGNETWLVLGGGGLLVVFPMAYSIILPALYIPVITMLLALIFRGVAFEFRFKADSSKGFWTVAFCLGSLIATFSQGVLLGAFVQGIESSNGDFTGGPFDWFSAFSMMTGCALVIGYAFLGSLWLIGKTEHDLQKRMFEIAPYLLMGIMFFMGAVSVWMPLLYSDIPIMSVGFDAYQSTLIFEKWFTPPNIYFTAPIPLLTFILCLLTFRALQLKKEWMPYIYSLGIYLMGFVGLGISLWPNIVPPSVSFVEAAAAPASQLFTLVGALIMLPVVLGYVGYVYYIFRGKVTPEEAYH